MTTAMRLDAATLVDYLKHDAAQLLKSESELVLDLSAIPRIDGSAAQALEELAELAQGVSARIVLRGVRIEAYKALKLLRLAQRFSYE